MKASVRQQRLLLQLQDLDNQLAGLERRAAAGVDERRLAELSREAEAGRAAVLAAQRELDSVLAALERHAQELQTMRARMARNEQQLASLAAEGAVDAGAADTAAPATSAVPHRTDALRDEQELLAARVSRVSEEAERLAHQRVQLQGRVDEGLAAADRAGSERARLLAAAEAEREEAARKLERLWEERAGVDAEITRELVAHYNQLRQRGGIAVARLRDGVSEASGMALSPAALAALAQVPADELAYCPSTGAILVRDF